MTMPVQDGVAALSEKEKQTLRLIVRGHDAESTARSLGLSVHTINERLRDARRKMAVSSSRQAARLLLDAESGAEGGGAGWLAPQSFGDTGIGADASSFRRDEDATPLDGVGRGHPRSRIIVIGGFLMTLALGLAALLALPQVVTTAPPASVAETGIIRVEVVDAAKHWLGLLDRRDWDASYRATAPAFRKLNTLRAWAAASEQARTPLGAMLSRTFLSEEFLPAPPSGYEVVKFHTRFANRDYAIETVTLGRQQGSWRVVGVTID